MLITLLSFRVLLSRMAKVSDGTKCISPNNELCLATPVLDLNSNELHYYSFMASLESCNGSCNTLDDLLNRLLDVNKTEDVN